MLRNALFSLKIVKVAERWGLCLRIPNVSPLRIPGYALHYNYLFRFTSIFCCRSMNIFVKFCRSAGIRLKVGNHWSSTKTKNIIGL